MITLAFHGAARTVTGSKYLLSVNDTKVLIDCGMFQGPRALRQRNWEPFPFDPVGINAVVLTHGHIDHIGMLPRLVKEGYAGKVYTSIPTSDIVGLSLRDAAHIQEEDARWRNKKKITRHKKALPLFTGDDADDAIGYLSPVPFDTWTEIAEGVRFRLHVAGHILGAAFVEFDVNDGNERRTIVFSGDIGRYGNPLTNNAVEPPECDYLICESTYGGRIHPPKDPYYDFEQIVQEIIDKKQVLLIPAFAIGRTQQITFLIRRLIKLGQIPPIDIHIDSPMAISATKIYVKYSSYHAIDLKELGGEGCVIAGKNVFLHRKRASSKSLNKVKGPAIIMSASGMMTAGRIMHHLLNRLGSEDSVIAVPGFMAEGTLGRRLSEGEKEVYIHKTLVKVKARLVKLGGLSGHADGYELLHWLEPIKRAPRTVFITHGEPARCEAMADYLVEERGWKTFIPQMGQEVSL